MHDSEVQALQQAIAALQAQREVLDAAVLEAAPLRKLRQVTILFLDIVGSTQRIQHLDPEDAQAVVDGALAAFSALVRQHGGEVLRYAGDNLKAAFGAARPADDDAERAVACGLALLQEAKRLGSAVLQAHGLPGFGARVGIHTGPVVRGGGVEQGSSLGGPAVHVAARIEQAARPGTLRISLDTYRQVQGLVDVDAQPQQALRTLLARQSVGNPYYMEALLQMLVDTGAARAVDGRWELQPESLQARKVPATLVGVLQATLDALDTRELRSLQQASVVGARFWDEALAALDPEAARHLPALARRELTLLQAQTAFAGTHEYAFRHHLLHQVTYDTVLKPDRHVVHARAARWLQGRGRGREGELASQIAEHFERAGDNAQAVPYWLRAAEDAAQREADVVAIDDGSDLRRRLRLHRVRADVHRRTGHADAHVREIETMESLIDRIDDEALRLSVAFDRVWRLSLEERFSELVDLALQRLASAPGGAPKDAARLHGLTYVGLGRFAQALEHARRAEEGFRIHAVHGAAWINAAAAARNLLALGRAEEAGAAAAALLAEVDDRSGWDGAFELAYLLHEVLAPLGHARAPALLTLAYQALNTQADRMAEHVPRDAFLRSVPVHRAICAQWEAAQAGAPRTPPASPTVRPDAR